MNATHLPGWGPDTTAGSYLGQQRTASGAPIPVNRQTGQIDINALIGQTLDRRKMYFYSTFRLAPGATVSAQPYRMFNAKVGDADQYFGNQVLTYVETNMESAGMFNPPYDCIVDNLMFKFAEDNRLFDILQISKMAYMEFYILQKWMWQGHLWRHPAGAGVSGYSTQAGESSWVNGVPEPGSIWYFGNFKKYIPPLVNFKLILNFPETYGQFYNLVGNLPSDVIANLVGNGTNGVFATNAACAAGLPSVTTSAMGGNGIQLICGLNGLSDGPVQ